MFSKAPWAGNGPFGRFEFGSGHFGSGFPKQLALLWPLRPSLVGVRKSAVGPDLTWSYTGPQYDADGVSVGAVPAIHGDKGVWCGPSYTNLQTVEPGSAYVYLSHYEDTAIIGPINGPVRKFYVDGAASGRFAPPCSVVAGNTYTYSIYAKSSGNAGKIGLFNGSSAASYKAAFDLDSGTIFGPIIGTPSMEYVGDGWYRLSITFTAVASGLLYCACSYAYTTGDRSVYLCGNSTTQSSIPMPYVPPGTTVASAAGTSGGNGLAWEMDSKLRECFERSDTDGVELTPDGVVRLTNASTTDGLTFNLLGAGNEVAFAPSSYVINTIPCKTYIARLTGYAGELSSNETITIRGLTNIGTVYSGQPFDVEYIFVATTDYNCVGFYGNATGQITISRASVQLLAPAKCTVASLVTAGAGSANITTDSNILTCKDTVAGMMYFASGGVIKATDGTNTATVTVTGGWAAGDSLLIALDYDGAGNFKVGYAKEADTALTYGTPVAADGSLNPLTKIRVALNNAYPRWMEGVEFWTENGVSLADMRKQFKVVGVL